MSAVKTARLVVEVRGVPFVIVTYMRLIIIVIMSRLSRDESSMKMKKRWKEIEWDDRQRSNELTVGMILIIIQQCSTFSSANEEQWDELLTSNKTTRSTRYSSLTTDDDQCHTSFSIISFTYSPWTWWWRCDLLATNGWYERAIITFSSFALCPLDRSPSCCWSRFNGLYVIIITALDDMVWVEQWGKN